MEPSPLTQQVRPEVFQQKVVKLYDALFKVGSYQAGEKRERAADILIRTKMTMRNQKAFGESSSC